MLRSFTTSRNNCHLLFKALSNSYSHDNVDLVPKCWASACRMAAQHIPCSQVPNFIGPTYQDFQHSGPLVLFEPSISVMQYIWRGPNQNASSWSFSEFEFCSGVITAQLLLSYSFSDLRGCPSAFLGFLVWEAIRVSQILFYELVLVQPSTYFVS